MAKQIAIKAVVPGWMDVIAFSMGRDSHERKKFKAEIVVPIFTEKFDFQEKCECCGKPLTAYHSMKAGMGDICASGKCLCKVDNAKFWTREEIMEVIHG